MHRMLVINVGGTSTKVAVFEDAALRAHQTIRHEDGVITALGDIWNQYQMRRQAVLSWLEEQGFSLEELDAVVSRGAPVKPMKQGVYRISRGMIADAAGRRYGNHPCSVGCKIAFDLGEELNIPAFTVDTPSTDELIPYARYTGLPSMERKSYYQALNQKAIARRLAEDLGKDYRELSAVVVHIGSGLSIAAHRKGRVIDVNNGLDGDGPMAPERAGTLPLGDVIRLCFSREHSYDQVYRMVNGQGGLFAHLGTKDCMEIERRIAAGDRQAQEVYCAMAYQIGKEIGGCACALEGMVEAVAFTGGLANSKYLMDQIALWVSWIAPLRYYPGEDEMQSLMVGALGALRGEVEVNRYE